MRYTTAWDRPDGDADSGTLLGMSDTASSTDLVDQAAARLPSMLDDLQQIIEVESPSLDYDAVARGADAVAQVIYERLDVRPERLIIDGVTHLQLTFGEGPPRMVLLCHQDTVWPLGTLDRLPFSVSDGVISGPGSFDMLTGVVMAIHAAALAQAGGHSLDGLCLLVTGDEEEGSLSSRDLMVDMSRDARAVLVFEAAGPGGTLKVGRKGVSMYTLHITGRAAHAGLEPWKGISALEELAAQLPHLAALADPDAGTTVTPTVFGGGTTSNTVPADAELMVDVRATSVAEQQRVDAAIRAVQPCLPGAQVTVSGEINRPPLERQMAEGLFATYADTARSLGLDVLEPIEVGGASDGNFTAAAGIPTLDGLGAVGDGAHAEHEHALVEELVPRTAATAAFITRLLA